MDWTQTIDPAGYPSKLIDKAWKAIALDFTAHLFNLSANLTIYTV